MNARLKCGVIAISILGVVSLYNSQNDYTTYRDYDVTVVNTFTGTTGRSSLQFIAVYELPNGQRFDKFISASTYASIKPGDNFRVNLRPFDVKQTTKDNILWFFGAAVLNSLAIITIPLFGIAAISRRLLKWISL